MQFGDGYAFLLGAVAMADGDGIVFQGLVIYRNTEGCADQILTGVPFTNGSRVFVDDVEIVFE